MNIFKLKNFIQNKVYLGHKVNYINYKLLNYVYKVYNNIIIIDIIQTRKYLLEVFYYLYILSKLNKDIIFINSKIMSKHIIKKASIITSNYYINTNLFKGNLTNWNNFYEKFLLLKWFNLVFKFIILKDKYKSVFLKKFNKLFFNLKKYIVNLTILPKTVIIVDPIFNFKLLTEALKLKLNIILISDINVNISGIKFFIPGNDDNILSLKLIFQFLILAILYGHIK